MLHPQAELQNRYRIIRKIGGGGMGTVYLAEDNRLPGRHCAIKEMSPAELAPQDRNWSIDAFRQEAQMLAQHPRRTFHHQQNPQATRKIIVVVDISTVGSACRYYKRCSFITPPKAWKA